MVGKQLYRSQAPPPDYATPTRTIFANVGRLLAAAVFKKNVDPNKVKL